MHFIPFQNYRGCGRAEGKTQSHNYSLHQRAEIAKPVLGFLCPRNELGLVNRLNFPLSPSCLLLNILCTCWDTEVARRMKLDRRTLPLHHSICLNISWFLCIGQWLLTMWSVTGFLPIPQSSGMLSIQPFMIVWLERYFIIEDVKSHINAWPLMTNTAGIPDIIYIYIAYYI